MTSTYTRQGWRLLAACLGHGDPDIFSAPTSPALVDRARAVCAGCPFLVRLACLDEAREYRDDHTIRAGLTPAQRRTLPRWRQDQFARDLGPAHGDRKELISV